MPLLCTRGCITRAPWHVDRLHGAVPCQETYPSQQTRCALASVLCLKLKLAVRVHWKGCKPPRRGTQHGTNWRATLSVLIVSVSCSYHVQRADGREVRNDVFVSTVTRHARKFGYFFLRVCVLSVRRLGSCSNCAVRLRKRGQLQDSTGGTVQLSPLDYKLCIPHLLCFQVFRPWRDLACHE